MSVIRVNKTQNYTVLSNHHFKEKGMSLKAKGLLSLMLSLPDDWDYSISGLVTLSKDGKDSVMSALSELEKFGYLKRNRTTDSKGRFSGVEYNIFEQPQQENPISEKQNSDNQNSEKSNSENPPQLNTNKINNLINKNTKELNTKEEGELNRLAIEDILSVVKDYELKNLYIDYIEMRKDIKSPLTKRGLEMLITRCERLSDFNIGIQKALLETAIINNWRNVYTPRAEEKIGRNQQLEELKKFYATDE
jgi:hypothetical protein